MKWDIRFTGTTEQIEAWPIPASSANHLQFKGIKKFVRLVADADPCLLDDMLVVAFAAAELAAGQEAADAGAKLQAAQTLYSRLKGRSKGASKIHTFADIDKSPPWPPKHVMIVTTG